MKRLTIWMTLIALTGFGCATSRTGTASSSTAPSDIDTTSQVASADELPAGSTLRVELDETLGEDTPRGETFTATVVEEIRSTDGSTVIPAGAKVHGEVTAVKRSENINDPAAIKLDFDSIEVANARESLDAEVVSTELTTDRDTSDVVRDVGIGAAAGAALGAIITGDTSGALIGGALGAGAGTAIALGTGDVDPELKAGTEMVIRTTGDVAIARR